jgi:hypothetical protein
MGAALQSRRLLVALKLRLGRYDLMKMPSGKIVPVPDSISFAASANAKRLVPSDQLVEEPERVFEN